MGECEAAGCVAEATQKLPQLPLPSSVTSEHPNYSPPQTSVQVCDEHAPRVLWNNLIAEVRILGIEGTEPDL